MLTTSPVLWELLQESMPQGRALKNRETPQIHHPSGPKYYGRMNA